MQINQLFVGAFVKYKRAPMVISIILDDAVTLQYITGPKQWEYLTVLSRELQPLRINHTWLTDFNFKLKKYHVVQVYSKPIKKVDCLLSVHLLPLETKVFLNDCYLSTIQYVHQLQQLYQLLGQKPLTIK